MASNRAELTAKIYGELLGWKEKEELKSVYERLAAENITKLNDSYLKIITFLLNAYESGKYDRDAIKPVLDGINFTLMLSGVEAAELSAISGFFNEVIESNLQNIDALHPKEETTTTETETGESEFSIEKVYGPGGPEYSKSPSFWPFVQQVRSSSKYGEVLGKVKFFQYEDELGNIVDIDPRKITKEAENKRAAQILLEQLNILVPILLDKDIFDSRRGQIYPSTAWDSSTDEFITLPTTTGGNAKYPYSKLVEILPTEVKPIFNHLSIRLQPFSIWYTRAAKQSFVAEQKVTFEKIVTVTQETSNIPGMDKVDIGNIETRQIPTDVKELTGLSEDVTWDLGDLLEMARYEINDIVRETKKDSEGKVVPAGFPVSAGDQKLMRMLDVVKESVSKKYLKYLHRSGRVSRSVVVLDESKQKLIDIAVRNAAILYRISFAEIAADSTARDSIASRALNMRKWFKSPTDPSRDYAYRDDVKFLFDQMAVTLDEMVCVTTRIPENALTKMTISEYFERRLSKYSKETIASWYKEGGLIPKEIRRVLGTFPPSCFSPDGSFITSEMDKYAVAYDIKPEHRIMGTEDADPIFVPISHVKKEQGTGYIQIMLDLDSRWNTQISSKYVDWNSATTSVYPHYSKLMDFMRMWFDELAVMGPDKIEKVFKKTDNKVLLASVVRKRGFKAEFSKFQLGISKWLSQKTELIRSGKGDLVVSEDGKYTGPQAISMDIDKKINDILGIQAVDLDEVVEFGFRKFVQLYADYFSLEMQITTSSWLTESGEVSQDQVATMPEIRYMFRDISDRSGIGPGFESHGLYLDSEFSEALREFEQSEYTPLGAEKKALQSRARAIKTGASTERRELNESEKNQIKQLEQQIKDISNTLKMRSEARLRFQSLWFAFTLILNPYRYKPTSETTPTLGSKARIRTVTGIDPMNAIQRRGLMTFFLSYQRELQDDTIKKYKTKISGRTLVREDIPFAFGEAEMKNEMVKQGILGSAQQGIVDLRLLDEIEKTPTYEDIDKKETGDKKKS